MRRQLRCRAEVAETLELSTPPDAQPDRLGDPPPPSFALAPLRQAAIQAPVHQCSRSASCRLTATCDLTAGGQDEAAASPSRAPTANTWQLDFCSRPILDERGKKVWELLICDEDRSFEYSRYFPNNKINSTQVQLIGRSIDTMSAISVLGAQPQPANKSAVV